MCTLKKILILFERMSIRLNRFFFYIVQTKNVWLSFTELIFPVSDETRRGAAYGRVL